MEAIFHEKQEGSLCAQHCLNSLLQGPYYTAVDLSIIAKTLDEEERERMAENGIDSEDYKNFIKQPSGNMDDSGYFSIQVISSALQVWGLELVPYTSTDERVKCCDPIKQQAFICNYQNHWFTIRKISNQWFNLNSLLAKPLLISDTYLALYLAQLKNEGYSIFVVFGKLPSCKADDVIRYNPIVPERNTKPTLQQTTQSSYDDDPELQAALKLSLSQDCDDYNDPPPSTSNLNRIRDNDLQKALELSLKRDDNIKTVEQKQDDVVNDEETELQKALKLSLSQETSASGGGVSSDASSSLSDDEEIQRALMLSLSNDSINDDDDRAMLRKAILLSMSNT